MEHVYSSPFSCVCSWFFIINLSTVQVKFNKNNYLINNNDYYFLFYFIHLYIFFRISSYEIYKADCLFSVETGQCELVCCFERSYSITLETQNRMYNSI